MSDRWLRIATLALMITSGCAVTYGDDDDSAASGSPPRIEFSSPSAGVLVLPQGGSLSFLAEGVDDDSLDLEWSYQLDDVEQIQGSEDDGRFSVEWTLEWSVALADRSVDVAFVVEDGGLQTRIGWPVDVAP